MDQRHQEYVEYYRARARKYENNPMYVHSAAAEAAMLEAISTAANLEEFGERLRANKLDLACAIARVRDHAIAEANFYTEIESHVRAKPHLEILETLDNTTYDNVQDLITMASEVQTRWNLPIARDETLLPTFWNDWKIMEDIESDEQAVVPERWHQERREAVAYELERGTKHFSEVTLPETRKFHPDYTPDYDLLWETRHRREIPLADDIVTLRIQGHKRYRGIA
jgi:hypothetical protein